MKRITRVIGLAPAAGPYSFATVTNRIVHTAGQIAQDSEGVLVGEDIETQTRQVMSNLEKILATAGVNFSHVIKATIYLTDEADFAIVNQVYASYFSQGEYPARATIVAASLPLGAKIEISMIAALPTSTIDL